MAFIESPRFPEDISFGTQGGPGYNTSIVVTSSGFEFANIRWQNARNTYNVAMGVRDQAEVEELIAFFHIAQGKGNPFRFKDWNDYKTSAYNNSPANTDQNFGTGDDSTVDFQLIKTYDLGGADDNYKDIKKPIDGTVLIAIDGSPQTETTHYTIDYTTGIVTFVAAPAGAEILTWGGEFDVPVRFDTDELLLQYEFYEHGSLSVPVVEVKVQ